MRFARELKNGAWLLDTDILLLGVVHRKRLRHVFIPNNKECGFSYQYVKRKDIGKILFNDDVHLVYSGLGHIERIY